MEKRKETAWYANVWEKERKRGRKADNVEAEAAI